MHKNPHMKHVYEAMSQNKNEIMSAIDAGEPVIFDTKPMMFDLDDDEKKIPYEKQYIIGEKE